jgi:hypothetical protein
MKIVAFEGVPSTTRDRNTHPEATRDHGESQGRRTLSRLR